MGKDKNVLYSIRENTVDMRGEIKINKKKGVKGFIYVCNWRNKMKLRPTQTRGGRVEVGRKNSRERPLFAEPDKAGNNGKVKPVYLEVFATMGFAVRNQGYWIASWVPNPQIKPSWKRELGLITLNLIIACILGYSIHHLGISMNTSRFIIQRKMNEKEAICFNLAFILGYFLTFLATFMFTVLQHSTNRPVLWCVIQELVTYNQRSSTRNKLDTSFLL